MNNLAKEREMVWIQIIYLFIIPTLIMYFKILPGNFRFLMLATVTLLLIGIAKHSKWTYKDIGVKSDFMKDLIPYLVFTIIGVGFLIFLSKVFPHNPLENWWLNTKFLLLFIPLSILQEIVFRGILMNMERRVFKSPVFIISLNAVLFAMMHVIYLNTIFVLPLTFVAGIGFAWIYYRYENLPLISIAHTILNFIGMILGFFVIR